MRTMPNNACFSSQTSTGLLRLRRILRSLAWLYTDIGYCQGMGMVREKNNFNHLQSNGKIHTQLHKLTINNNTLFICTFCDSNSIHAWSLFDM